MATNPQPKLRVLADANVLVAASAWPRWPYEVILHAVKGDYQLVLSRDIIKEARQSLARINEQFVAQFDAILDATNYEEAPGATPEEITFNAFDIRDPKDIHVATVAVTAQVDCLVTHDKDLTDNNALKNQIPVILPAVFLRDYLGWTSEQLEAIRQRRWPDLK